MRDPPGGNQRAYLGNYQVGQERSERGSLAPGARGEKGARELLPLSPPPLGAAAPPPPLPRFPSPEWEWSGAPGSAPEPLPSAPRARTRRGRGKGGARDWELWNPTEPRSAWCAPLLPLA